VLGLRVRDDEHRDADRDARLDDTAGVVPEDVARFRIVLAVERLEKVGARPQPHAQLAQQELRDGRGSDVGIGVRGRDDRALVLPAVVIRVRLDARRERGPAGVCGLTDARPQALAEAADEGDRLVVDAGEGSIEVEDDALGAAHAISLGPGLDARGERAPLPAVRG
jgi:hypothetical protein